MKELRDEVLQAEVAILKLAEELSRAKGIADNVMIVEKRLSEAADIVKQSQETLRSAYAELNSAISDLKDAIEQTNKNFSYLNQNIKNLSEQIAQDILKVHQNITEHLSQQSAEIKRLLSWFKIYTIFFAFSILSIIVVILLLR